MKSSASRRKESSLNNGPGPLEPTIDALRSESCGGRHPALALVFFCQQAPGGRRAMVSKKVRT
jgi:hypothetical protein